MAAAYAALVSLSHILNQILHPPPTHHFLIPTEQIRSLLEQVSSFVDFLEKYSKSEEFTEDLEKRIVGAAHKAEDIIESYVVTKIQARYKIHPQRKSSAPFLRRTQKEMRELLPIHKGLKEKSIVEVISEFISIQEDLDEIRRRRGMEDVTPENFKEASSSRSLPGGKNFMIGFDEHLKQIKTALVTYESGLQIIPVVGMGGIGKTTLATNVYNDAYIVEYFDVRAWVSISQEYMERHIIMTLLQQFYSNIETNKLNADELGNLLHKQLFGRRYFIVLDDMWDSQAWEQLKLFLPDNNNGSRIVVTTRLLNLAKGFESCEPYQIGLLNDDCSWALILEQVFGKEDCPNELQDIGKSIARKCGGLPLALVVIGGLLARSHKTREFWEYVEENVTSAANEENDEQCMKILRLSYSQLQVYLQPCFLYLAVFPKNVEIRVSRLIKLWVAEGFIKPASGRTLEEVAEGYLNDLFDTNLIMVSKRGLTGKVKICSIHDLVRDLITREVHKNKFLCIAMLDNFSPHMKNERRLSIHIGTAQDETCEVLRSSTLNRSFLSYSKWKSRRCLDRSLNLLRILDVVDFYSMEDILPLFNSRYITCGTPRESQALSSLISLLWNLQTLVVPGSLSLPSEIWQMPQLRHLKMPGITLPDPQEESDSIIVLENLQTLSTVKDFIFREQVLERIPNLKKLGIRCDAIEKLGFFCLSNIASLRKLESLVLAFRGTWENMAFPKSLKKLSLSYCQIPWEDMHVVGSLPNLEVLKLQSRAAKGQTWSLNADEFCQLKFLLIEQCEMETWVADDGCFPCLEQLHLVSMKMKEIPMEFAEIPTLQTIDLNYCSRSLFASAKKISKEREDFGYEEIQVRSFSHLRIDKQTLFEHARKNMYCSRCNGLLLEGFLQIVMYGKSLQQDAAGGPYNVRATDSQIDGDLCMDNGCHDDIQDPSVHPWGGLTTARDGTLTLLDYYLYSKSLKGLRNVFDSARVRERERELLYPDACGGGGRGWISQGITGYGRGHGTRETCAPHTARLSVETLVDFWSALREETRQSLLRMKEEDFIERLMYRFDSKRFCRDCRRNVIREFKELKELKRMRRETRCTSWFCVADTAFQYEVSHDTVQADWHQTFSDAFGTYHHFEWAIGTGEGKSDILDFENVGLSGRVQVNGLDLSGLNACYITLRAWKMDGRCNELCVKAHALRGQQCVHCRLVVGDGFVTITRGERIRRFFEHAEEAEEEEDGNELDGECSRPHKHAKSPELAREFILDAATVIFKEQVEKAFRQGTARHNAHSLFVCLALKLLEERVHMKLLEEEEREKREEEERKERRRTKEREKKLRRKERLRERENVFKINYVDISL